jgi:hypothetical protein
MIPTIKCRTSKYKLTLLSMAVYWLYILHANIYLADLWTKVFHITSVYLSYKSNEKVIFHFRVMCSVMARTCLLIGFMQEVSMDLV